MSQKKYIERSVNVFEYLKNNLSTTKTMETTLRDPVFSLIINEYFPDLATLEPKKQFMILYNQRSNLQVPKDWTVTERIIHGGFADISHIKQQQMPIPSASASSSSSSQKQQRMPIPSASASSSSSSQKQQQMPIPSASASSSSASSSSQKQQRMPIPSASSSSQKQQRMPIPSASASSSSASASSSSQNQQRMLTAEEPPLHFYEEEDYIPPYDGDENAKSRKRAFSSEYETQKADKKRKIEQSYCVPSCKKKYESPDKNPENCFSTQLECLRQSSRHLISSHMTSSEKDALQQLVFDPETSNQILRDLKTYRFFGVEESFSPIAYVNALKQIILKLIKEKDHTLHYKKDIQDKLGFVEQFATFYLNTSDSDDAMYFLRLASVLEKKMVPQQFLWFVSDIWDRISYTHSYDLKKTIKINGIYRNRAKVLMKNMIRFLASQDFLSIDSFRYFPEDAGYHFDDLILLAIEALTDLRIKTPNSTIWIMDALLKNFDFNWKPQDVKSAQDYEKSIIIRQNRLRAQLKSQIANFYLSESVAAQIIKESLPQGVKNLLKEEAYEKRFNALYLSPDVEEL